MITFNDLLTDPKYREMSKVDLTGIIVTPYVCSTELITEGRKYFNLKEGQIFSEVLFNHLQKLKAESEKKAEPKLDHSNDAKQYLTTQINQSENMIFNRKSLPEEIDITKYIKPAPIQITDQKAREIAAKYFNCNPNEIKIV